MKSKSILLLEPDKSIATSVKDYLALNQYVTTQAHTAEEAIALADKGTYSCIVMELVLGAHSGIEFLHEFHSYGDLAKVPVIIFTSQLMQNNNAFNNLGVKEYLYKPNTSLLKLLESINKHVNNS